MWIIVHDFSSQGESDRGSGGGEGVQVEDLKPKPIKKFAEQETK